MTRTRFATYLLAPAFITSSRDLRSLTRTLFSITQIMIGVHAHLLARGELEHVLMLMLIVVRRATHVAGIRRAQNHPLTMVNAMARSITQARTRCLTRELRGEELVGGHLAVAIIGHRALGHLRPVWRRVRRARRHIRLFAGVHHARLCPKRHVEIWVGRKRASGRWGKVEKVVQGKRRQGFLPTG